MYNTDKDYWHRYLPEYERLVFSQLPENPRILEIGVLGGESIRMLRDRFPEADLVGADINLKSQDSWFADDKITYKQVDQSNVDSVRKLLVETGVCDLIIDDGSHFPAHQALTFKQCLSNPPKYYIIEDAHSSFWDLRPSPLVLFLALKHHRDLGKSLSIWTIQALESENFSSADITTINDIVKEIHVFRRADLPLQCFKCRKSDFDYTHLRCLRCQENLYLPYDSISLILKF